MSLRDGIPSIVWALSRSGYWARVFCLLPHCPGGYEFIFYLAKDTFVGGELVEYLLGRWAVDSDGRAFSQTS